MLVKYVNPDHCIVEVRMSGFDNLIMLVFFIVSTVECFEQELKESL